MIRPGGLPYRLGNGTRNAGPAGEKVRRITPTNKRWRMDDQKKTPGPVGSVMVVGGGIAGMQSALDLANSGYYVYLVEKTSAIGGLMSRLDKTFPTNDCAM